MNNKLVLIAVTILAGAQFATISAASAAKFKAETNQQQIGLLLPAVQAANAFRATPRTSKDTCNESGQSTGPNHLACNPDKFIAACDAADGGLSTDPDGGMTCELAELD